MHKQQFLSVVQIACGGWLVQGQENTNGDMGDELCSADAACLKGIREFENRSQAVYIEIEQGELHSIEQVSPRVLTS